MYYYSKDDIITLCVPSLSLAETASALRDLNVCFVDALLTALPGWAVEWQRGAREREEMRDVHIMFEFFCLTYVLYVTRAQR